MREPVEHKYIFAIQPRSLRHTRYTNEETKEVTSHTYIDFSRIYM